jgi:hypothetical protein
MNRRKIKELIKQLQKQLCNEMETLGKCSGIYDECISCNIHKIVNEILNELNNGD